ncbi:MAG: lipase family protein [Silvanigrellaceae bacterium]
MRSILTRRKAQVFVSLGLLMSSAATAIEAHQRAPVGVLVKDREPACQFNPTFEFTEPQSVAWSNDNMASAAWFARAVQLVDELRAPAWEKLPERPLRVRDFVLKKFGLHGTLLEFSDRALMLYRGTEDALDYVLNGTFFTTSGEKFGLPGWVHNGFLVNFLMTWPDVHEELKSIAAKGKSIVFASHSLGGVLSQYAAWLLENEGIRVGRIYAFQSPNPGDLDFKNAFEKRFAGRASNTIYGEDVTPHIPPILESTDAFGSSVPKPLSQVVVGLLNRARYGTLTERFAISGSGAPVAVPNADVNDSEIRFWSSYLSKSGGKPFPLGLGPDSPFVADHDIDKVLCSLVKSLD